MQVKIYRSFNNLKITGNFCLHTWLLALEEQYIANGRTNFGTLFHQIDGGSENANIITLVICFMLVLKGIALKVVLTRLLPGHTHEDIDALFALIWNLLRDKHCLSPDEFVAILKKALESKHVVDVEDIFAVPDYEEFFAPHIDAHFGRFAKQEWTQLQFTFERVAACDR
jgi:hypothetical protein